jgi:hypothetical protein
MKVKLVRKVCQVTYDGGSSIEEHQIVEAEITFLSPDGNEPKVDNPQYSYVGEWKVVKP